MKGMTMNVGKVILLTGFLSVAACGGGASYDPESPEGQAYDLRHGIMEEAGEKMQLLNNMARESIPIDEAAFVAAAEDLAELTARMGEGFEVESVLPGVSRSLAEIWANKADFDSRMQTAVEATAELAATAQTSGFAAAQSMVAASPGFSGTYCGSCHNTYRGPEID